jgi:DNA-binding MarR family transcriptional regulator
MKGAGGDADRVWQLLVKVYLAQRGQLPAEAGDLSPVQCHVLHLIEPGRPMAMNRLAEALACDASNVTGLIDRLESRGLVQRRQSPDDRRVKILDLTPAGSRVRARLVRRMCEEPLPLSRLSPREQRTLLKILERLVGG